MPALARAPMIMDEDSTFLGKRFACPEQEQASSEWRLTRLADASATDAWRASVKLSSARGTQTSNSAIEPRHPVAAQVRPTALFGVKVKRTRIDERPP